MVTGMLLTGGLFNYSHVTGIDGRLAFQIDPGLTRDTRAFREASVT
jgi:hypothetical protein